MKKIFGSLLSFLMLFSAISCHDDEPSDQPPTNIQLDLKSAQIIDADNQFGLELFQQLLDEESGNSNLMISPLSVSLALAMAYNGADGDTKSQMEALLHKNGFSPDEINKAYQNLVDALASHDSRVNLEIANAVFYNRNFSVKSSFLQTNKVYYQAEVKDLDFSNAAATLKTVNDWVKLNTNNKIESILDQVSPYDVLYLLNAVYFKGIWTYQFDKKETRNRVFFLEDGRELSVPTMVVEETFRYTDQSQFELIELPYGGEKYAMLIFLPKSGYSADDVARLLTPEDLSSWLSNMHGYNKKVFLPKFEFSYDKGLTETLKALGMTDAFSPYLANFSGISDANDLFVSDVLHKTYLKVDEQGTEAAAVTAVIIGTTSAGPDPVFAVDHPFVFAIREKDTNAILFIGKVSNPLK
ncbi:serpin family protein [Gaoshiqia sp. Z1-71]|uniref:serpin family protein n=1 Tax=Gaoshiqia hydrogeniformans TaxID=3290090 RepID=UPI003BF86EE0